MEKEEEDNEGNDILKSWLNHPYTTKLRKWCEENQRAALVNMIGMCSTSSDPKVRAAGVSYMDAKGIHRMLSGEDAV